MKSALHTVPLLHAFFRDMVPLMPQQGALPRLLARVVDRHARPGGEEFIGDNRNLPRYNTNGGKTMS
jgi:hypothetical protein